MDPIRKCDSGCADAVTKMLTLGLLVRRLGGSAEEATQTVRATFVATRAPDSTGPIPCPGCEKHWRAVAADPLSTPEERHGANILLYSTGLIDEAPPPDTPVF